MRLRNTGDKMTDIQLMEKGYKALTNDLGIKFIYFVQQFRPGQGDCVKEKYERPPLSAEEIKEGLLKLKAKSK